MFSRVIFLTSTHLLTWHCCFTKLVYVNSELGLTEVGLQVTSQLTIRHRPDVGPMTALSGKFLGPKAAKCHRPDRIMLVGLMAGRWQHADQMPIKSDIGPPASQRKMPTAGRCRLAEQMPSICRANPTLARPGADVQPYSGPTSVSQHSRCRPDSDPMGIRTAGRRRVTTWMWTKPASARQWPDGHTDSGPTSGYHLNADQMPILLLLLLRSISRT